MVKAAIILISLSALLACGCAPPPTFSNAQQFSVISEDTNSATSTLTITIKVSGAATQSNVRSAAESLIAGRRNQYRQIVVKSYTEEMTPAESPFAISRLEGDKVTHHFNSVADTQKIPTH